MKSPLQMAAGFAGGVALGVAGKKARQRLAKKRRKVKKNPSVVAWLALGMFTWGLIKAATLARHVHPHPDCPMCAESQMRAISHPRHLIRSVLTAPVTEEVMFRHNLQPLIGQQAAAIAFGAMHASSRLSAGGNMLRVLEAGLAGGLVYGHAYNHAGVLGSALVHAAHNAGADLGVYLTAKKTARVRWAEPAYPCLLTAELTSSPCKTETPTALMRTPRWVPASRGPATRSLHRQQRPARPPANDSLGSRESIRCSP